MFTGGRLSTFVLDLNMLFSCLEACGSGRVGNGNEQPVHQDGMGGSGIEFYEMGSWGGGGILEKVFRKQKCSVW